MNAPEIDRAATFETSDDLDAINRLYRERRWSDGLPIVPPTRERVERMLQSTTRGRYDVVARIAPGYGAATIERIAINAVMAGCEPDYLPVLIAACEAVAEAQFNLQGIQATTNPVADNVVFMLVYWFSCVLLVSQKPRSNSPSPRTCCIIKAVGGPGGQHGHRTPSS